MSALLNPSSYSVHIFISQMQNHCFHNFCSKMPNNHNTNLKINTHWQSWIWKTLVKIRLVFYYKRLNCNLVDTKSTWSKHYLYPSYTFIHKYFGINSYEWIKLGKKNQQQNTRHCSAWKRLGFIYKSPFWRVLNIKHALMSYSPSCTKILIGLIKEQCFVTCNMK